jgi:hypothetical protein
MRMQRAASSRAQSSVSPTAISKNIRVCWSIGADN